MLYYIYYRYPSGLPGSYEPRNKETNRNEILVKDSHGNGGSYELVAGETN